MVKKLFNKVFKPNRYNVGRAMVIFNKVINIWKQLKLAQFQIRNGVLNAYIIRKLFFI